MKMKTTVKKRRPMPPKGPGGTPASDTKAARAAQVKLTEVEYTLGCCYRLLREMGHQPLVASAMLNSISAGFSLADIEAAMKKFGDL
jgi:hypothetical protein